jgi:hypothetical protein
MEAGTVEHAGNFLGENSADQAKRQVIFVLQILGGWLVHVDLLIDFYKHRVILFHRHTYKVTLQPSTCRKIRLIESKAKCVII